MAHTTQHKQTQADLGLEQNKNTWRAFTFFCPAKLNTILSEIGEVG